MTTIPATAITDDVEVALADMTIAQRGVYRALTEYLPGTWLLLPSARPGSFWLERYSDGVLLWVSPNPGGRYAVVGDFPLERRQWAWTNLHPGLKAHRTTFMAARAITEPRAVARQVISKVLDRHEPETARVEAAYAAYRARVDSRIGALVALGLEPRGDGAHEARFGEGRIWGYVKATQREDLEFGMEIHGLTQDQVARIIEITKEH